MDKYTINKQYFGHSQFRSGQESLIDSILAGQDCLGVMPTGGGKSLCYQIPALLLPGLTLVISPLISLMADQVAALQRAGVPAACLHSGLDSDQYRQVYRSLRRGELRLLYVAPERLLAEGFLALSAELDLSLLAVDEAHCISQWGQDFRPSYLKILDFIDGLPRRPVLAAFTATATADVRQDIIRLLQLQAPTITVTGFDRPNLFFDVRRPKNKRAVLLSLLRERTGKSGILYCSTRANVEQVCQELNDQGFPATRYHAGLSDEERRQNQDDFQFDRKPIMVATNAFGMGIDKSNVSFVIHWNMPKSVEAYYQEAGRAGRDGEPADCILLYSPGDVTTAKFLIEHGGDQETLAPEGQQAVRHKDYLRLEQMANYCKTTSCLRGYLLNYFGQDHPDTCGHCGTCQSHYMEEDITRAAQMILSCVKRVHDRLGYYVGAALIARVLHGSREQRILQLHLDSLSTYGLLQHTSQKRIRETIDHLEQLGCLKTDPRHGALQLTEAAGPILFHGQQVTMPVKVEPAEPSEPARQTVVPAGVVDEDLFAMLKAVRTKLAQQEQVPAYIIFSNATLRDMTERAPRTQTEFLDVSGVGEVKAARYGEFFLRAINDYKTKIP